MPKNSPQILHDCGNLLWLFQKCSVTSFLNALDPLFTFMLQEELLIAETKMFLHSARLKSSITSSDTEALSGDFPLVALQFDQIC